MKKLKIYINIYIQPTCIKQQFNTELLPIISLVPERFRNK